MIEFHYVDDLKARNGFDPNETVALYHDVVSLQERIRELETALKDWIHQAGMYAHWSPQRIQENIGVYFTAETPVRQAHSKSEYKRLTALGVECAAPETACEVWPCPNCGNRMTHAMDCPVRKAKENEDRERSFALNRACEHDFQRYGINNAKSPADPSEYSYTPFKCIKCGTSQ